MTEQEAQTLKKPLRRKALRLSTNFPRWLLSLEDFTQAGYLGALSIPPNPDPHIQWMLQVQAGGRQMIDEMRSFSDPRGARTLEVLHPDLTSLSDLLQPTHSLPLAELLLSISKLPFRERTILFLLYSGYTQKEVAARLSLSEGRISQLYKGILLFLREELLP